MTKGGLKGDVWINIAEVPGGRLAAKWRYLLCQRLRQRRPDNAALQRVIAQTYTDHHGFQVHTDSFYPKGLDAAQYIGRYLGHPPIATSHLGAYDGQQVTYWCIDTATKVKQTITCSALDFISRLVPHIPPKGMQLVHYAGLYAHSIKRQCAELAHTALEALRTQLPLFALEPLRKVLPNPKWRERITPSGPPSPQWGDGQGQASFGYDPLACPRCGQTMQLAEIWEPKRGHVWMKQWLETHRAIKALREAFTDLRQRPLDRYQQLGLGFSNTS